MKAEILKILKKAEEYVSGQQLCEQLGVSRTAVWKAIRQLEEELDEMQAAAPRFTETKVPRSDFAGKGYDPKKDQNPIIRPFRPED